MFLTWLWIGLFSSVEVKGCTIGDSFSSVLFTLSFLVLNTASFLKRRFSSSNTIYYTYI